MCYGMNCEWEGSTGKCRKPRHTSCPNENEPEREKPMSDDEAASLDDFLAKLDAGFYDKLFRERRK